MADCLSLMELDRLVRNQVSDEERARMRAHLGTCSQCAAEYDEFKSDASFLEHAQGDLRAAVESSITMTAAPSSSSSSTPIEHLPRIEGYEIVGILGRGGMAVVYEAVQTRLNRPVALKLLPAVAGSANPQLITRFKREATASAKLHHTHIVPIYDFGESRDGYYYAMELIRGQTLRELIKRLAATNVPDISAPALAAILHGSQPASDGSASGLSTGSTGATSSGATSGSSRGRVYYRQVARWIANVADGLHYAHINGVIHRDVKPSNLILSIDGRLMIADFGLAKVDDDHSVTMSGSLLGTYRYMSPEQVSGARRVRVDQRTDVYSLGATLYELLTFQPAYRADNREELLGEILFREPTAPRKIIPAVPIELQTICQKAMEKSPEQRYASAREVAEDLRRYIDDLPIVAKAPSVVGRARKFVERRPALSALIGLFFVSAVTTTLLVRHGSSAVRRADEARKETIDEWVMRGQTAFREGRFADYADAYALVLDQVPDDIKAMFNLANARKYLYYQTDDESLLSSAEQLIDRGLAIPDNPHRREFLNFKGVLQRNRGDYQDAIQTFNEVIALDASKYEPWCNLGFTYVMLDDFAKAEEAWQTSLANAGDSLVGSARCNLGALRIHANNAAAEDALAPAYAADRTNIYTLLHMARLHLEVDELLDPRMANKYADTADTLLGDLKNEPLSGRVKRVVAQAKLAEQDWQAAIVAANQALELGDEPQAFAYGILAVAYTKSGDQAQSAAHLANLKRTWPNAMREKGYAVTPEEGVLVWIDSYRILQDLSAAAESDLPSSNQ